MNIPNSLTVARAGLMPFVIFFYYFPVSWGNKAAAIIFGIACITDWLDGYLARRLGEHTAIGALLDPIADKILVVMVLAMLIHSYQSFVITISAMVIISREIIISALREWMAEIGKRANVAVSNLGKVKTAVQMVALAVLLSNHPGSWMSYVGYLLLVVAAVMTLWSMFIYLKSAKNSFKDIDIEEH